jgi:hypothetical protein
MKDILVKHLRDDFQRPFATIVAVKVDDSISLGVSICSSKDQFNKRIGRRVAIGRAKRLRSPNMPSRMYQLVDDVYKPIKDIIEDALDDMCQKVQKYFNISKESLLIPVIMSDYEW